MKEHSKFCVIANTWDMIALSNEDHLQKVATEINKKIEAAGAYAKNNQVDVDLLVTLKKIAQRFAIFINYKLNTVQCFSGWHSWLYEIISKITRDQTK